MAKPNSQMNSRAATGGTKAAGTLGESIRQTVGLVALAITTLFLEAYLRILDHLQPCERSSRDEVDSNANIAPNSPPEPITWAKRLRIVFSAVNALHICRFCQRFITTQALIAIAYALWPTKLSKQLTLILTVLILPRLNFAILIIMQQRNLNPPRGPPDPNRHVNLTLLLLHYTYKGVRGVFKVFNGLEQITIYLCQTIEFILVQLLGYTYSSPLISFYTELESILVLSVLYYLKLTNYTSCLLDEYLLPLLANFMEINQLSQCVLPTEILLMLSLYLLKFVFKLM